MLRYWFVGIVHHKAGSLELGDNNTNHNPVVAKFKRATNRDEAGRSSLHVA